MSPVGLEVVVHGNFFVSVTRNVFVLFILTSMWATGAHGEFVDLGLKERPNASAQIKLKAIEDYNSNLESLSDTRIEYSSKWIYLGQDPLNGRNQNTLKVTFHDLTPDQFEVVKQLFGGVSRRSALPGVNDYDLSEFLSPFIQATYGHSFSSLGVSLETLNQCRPADENPNDYTTEAMFKKVQLFSPDYIAQSYTNCWSTVYGFLYFGGLSAQSELPKTFTVYDPGDAPMKEFLYKKGSLISSGFLQGDQENLAVLKNNVRYGDIIVVESRHRQDYGDNAGEFHFIMEHAAVVIDTDVDGEPILFEKMDAGRTNPYRFVKFSEAVDYYKARPHGTKVSLIRFGKELVFKDPLKEFAIQPDDPTIPARYLYPMPNQLQDRIRLQRFSETWEAGDYRFLFAVITDVSIGQDPETGRFQLGSGAYKPENFDVTDLVSCDR